MSFVARRVHHDHQATRPGVCCVGPSEGRTDQIGVLMVGVDDETAVICAAVAMEVGASFARVAHGPAACRSMQELRPRVVVLPRSLFCDERYAVVCAADEVGADVVEVADRSTPEALAVSLVRAMTAGESRLAS